MPEENDIKTQQKIKSFYSRTIVVSGTFMGIAMCIYFCTYGTLLDLRSDFLLWFEAVTTVLFIFGLIYLKRMSLFITKVLLSRNTECRRMLQSMTVADIEKVAQ